MPNDMELVIKNGCLWDVDTCCLFEWLPHIHYCKPNTPYFHFRAEKTAAPRKDVQLGRGQCNQAEQESQ